MQDPYIYDDAFQQHPDDEEMPEEGESAVTPLYSPAFHLHQYGYSGWAPALAYTNYAPPPQHYHHHHHHHPVPMMYSGYDHPAPEYPHPEYYDVYPATVPYYHHQVQTPLASEPEEMQSNIEPVVTAIPHTAHSTLSPVCSGISARQALNITTSSPAAHSSHSTASGGHGGNAPTSADACATIVGCLMCYHTGREEDFSRKAIESLIKKLKDKRDELDALITSVSTSGQTPSKCVTIQRTLDGRLQVAGRKGFPHVVYARIWRWPDLHKNELKHLRICQCAFDMKCDLVCVNPYHYERVASPGVGQLDLSNLKINASGIRSTDALSLHDDQSDSDDDTSAPTYKINHPPASMSSNEAFSPQSSSGARRSLSFEHSDSKPTHPHVKMEPASVMDRQSGLLATSGAPAPLRYPTSAVASLSLQMSPGTIRPMWQGFDQQASVVLPTTPVSPVVAAQQASVAADAAVVNTVVLEPLSVQPFPESWCTISYYELTEQVGETYKVPASVPGVIIDGGVDPSCVGRFCLGALSNVHRTEASEKTRHFIGKGIRLDVKGEGDVWLTCLSDMAVFVHSHYLDREAGRAPGDAVHKIYPQASLKIFDIRQCYHQLRSQTMFAHVAAAQQAAAAAAASSNPFNSGMQTTLTNQARQTAAICVDELRRLCVLRVSFVKGWGPDYRRVNIKDTPCWIEVQLHRALQLLDEVLHSMPSLLH